MTGCYLVEVDREGEEEHGICPALLSTLFRPPTASATLGTPPLSYDADPTGSRFLHCDGPVILELGDEDYSQPLEHLTLAQQKTGPADNRRSNFLMSIKPVAPGQSLHLRVPSLRPCKERF